MDGTQQPAAEAAESARPAEVRQLRAKPESEALAPPAAPKVLEPPPRKGGVKKVIGLLVLAALIGFGAREGEAYWTDGRFMISTDDAYLQADITAIAPRVQGYVQKIEVTENQRVTAGDVLLRLDDGDYQNALKTAESQVATQAETIKRIEAQIEAARTQVAVAEAQKLSADAALDNARTTADRIARLAQSSVAAQAQVDDANAALAKAEAAEAAAAAQIDAANANVAVLQAQAAEATSQMETLKVAVAQAQRNLDLTVLRAPIDGVVANLAVHEGDLVSSGQKIAAVVPVDSIYVEANYKETQLADIGPGAKVTVVVDALKGKTFEGRVSSIAPATGSQFALLPADNATGNFTKIVQRVPVRITLDPEAIASGALRAGLSVVVSVDSRTVPGR